MNYLHLISYKSFLSTGTSANINRRIKLQKHTESAAKRISLKNFPLKTKTLKQSLFPEKQVITVFRLVSRGGNRPANYR